MNELANCIHCGLCLEACPTYRVLGDEAESPRGRLRLMHELQQRAALDFSPLDHCLGCRGCESVCPSGVPYGEHLERARERREPGLVQRLLVDQLLARPTRMRAAIAAGRIARRLRFQHILPSALGNALRALPEPRHRAKLPADDPDPTVLVLAGCSHATLQPEVFSALFALIAATGERPALAHELGCCGALSAHQGSPRHARQLRERIRPRLPLLVPSAGCSAHLRGVPQVHDALAWLAERATSLCFQATPERVLYHPPCHHTHAQGLRGLAERLLAAVPGLYCLEQPDKERCCGSAGSYSLLQPRLAARVRNEKWADLRQAAAQRVLSANPGCELHLAAGRQPADPPIGNLFVFLASRLGTAQGNR